MARKRADAAPAAKPAEAAANGPLPDALPEKPVPPVDRLTAAWVVLLVAYAAWFASLAAGVYAYEGEPVTIKPQQLPLYHFDRVFRAAGGAFVFAFWAVRALCTLDFCAEHRRASVWIPLAWHAAQTALRWALYAAHRAGLIFDHRTWSASATPASAPAAPHHHPAHVMSDHILLAACVVAGLSCEGVMALLARLHSRTQEEAKLLGSLARMAMTLAAMVGWECYFTARYFHPPAEIVTAAVLGLVVFQAPLLAFSAQSIRRALARQKAA